MTVHIVEWDGATAYGIDAEVWGQEYPLPPGGRLLFVVNDEGGLVMVANVDPRSSGRVPITDENRDAVGDFLLASVQPAPPIAPPADPVTREEFDMLLTMVLEG